jgi:hypothetical protein
MSTNVDDQVRASLQRWAAEVPEGPGDPYAAMIREARPAAGRLRGVRWAAVTAAAAAVAIAVAGLAPRPPEPVPPASWPDQIAGPAATKPVLPTAPGPPAIAGLPTVLLRADGWLQAGATIRRFTDGTSRSVYHFGRLDGRQFQLSLHAPDQHPPGSVPRADQGLTVHRQSVSITDLGPGIYQFDWVEFSRMWTAESVGFASLDEFAATLEQLELVDEATFRAALPQLADAVSAHPDQSVDWWAGAAPEVGPATTCPAPPTRSCGAG